MNPRTDSSPSAPTDVPSASAPRAPLAVRSAARFVSFDLAAKQELNNGFGNALSKAFELAVTPFIFGFLGWLLDRKLDTRPVFMLTFGLVVLVYLAWKMLSDYDRDMKRQESKLRSLATSTSPDRADG